MYIGPEGTFADPSKVSLLDDFSQARLVWQSEDKSLGWGKTTSHEGATTKRAPGFYPSGQGSLIVAGGLVIAGYYIPSGDVICKDAEGCAPEFRQRALISADDVILAVDAATGKTRWKQVFAGKGLSRAHSKRPTYGPTPAAAGGRVFHLGTTGRVYAVELATGKPIWESDIGEGHKAFEATKVKLLQERADPHVKGDGPLVMITSLVVCADVLVAPAGTKAIGFDAAGGRKLWEIAEALSGCNAPCPATVEGQAAFFCVNGKGEMRLIRAKSGEVLWTQKLGNGISHTTQPVVARGKAFLFEPIASDAAGKKSEGALGAPVCYGLSLSGARKLWMLSAEFKHGMGYDGGPSAKIGYRDGAVYFGSLDTSSVVAVKAEDGTVLGKLSPANWGHFHLWGDRLVLIGDNSHESMGGPCTYTPYTIPDLKPAGKPYAPRGRQGVSGYILPIRDPFADGYQFMRTATGQIWCYDIRKR
jgi:outer membrane protein assembly factor BamB